MSFNLALTPTQWILGATAALLIGISKTGMPGVGILSVPLMAQAFGGRPSIGALTPMLLFADCFAVAWYRRHARWDKLGELIPWVGVGMAAGAALLWKLGTVTGSQNTMNILIGVLVLTMLAIHLARLYLGDRLTPHSRWGVITAGGASGFATSVSNAAGPIMSIYMSSMGLSKEQFMGTTAWYYFIFNLTKIPIYIALSLATPDKPLLTASSLLFDLAVCPLILLGVFAGRWLLPRVPQRFFDALVLILAALAALNLVLSSSSPGKG